MVAKNYGQINVKIPLKLLDGAEEYVKDFGYSNVQELIRDTLRDKVFEEKLNSKFVKEVLNNPEYKETIGVIESKKLFEKLKNAA